MPSPGELPDPGIKLGSPALQADSLPAELPGKPSFQHTFKSVARFIPKYFLFFRLLSVVFFTSMSDCPFLVHKNASDFLILILDPALFWTQF